jgi:anti-sigma factor RsiW
MSDNVEQIEARLCAYVDSELSPSERAEIEKHLAANPAHLVLIHDLIAQRAMVRQLPREKAPPI